MPHLLSDLLQICSITICGLVPPFALAALWWRKFPPKKYWQWIYVPLLPVSFLGIKLGSKLIWQLNILPANYQCDDSPGCLNGLGGMVVGDLIVIVGFWLGILYLKRRNE